MPYIEPGYRALLNDCVDLLQKRVKKSGELVYVLHRFFNTLEPSFSTFAEYYGAVDLFLREYFRREVSEYEEQKRMENGDVV